MHDEPSRQMMPDAITGADQERLLADAAALERLAATPEWAVLDRLMGEHAARLLLVLRSRGLDHTATEALRAELEAVEWLRYRPIALRRALDDRETILRARAAAEGRVTREPVLGREAL